MRVPNYSQNIFGPMHSHHEVEQQDNKEREDSDNKKAEDEGHD